jgi:TPP-dependent pyruvate/acetoin dehydrogenase alpha subunit
VRRIAEGFDVTAIDIDGTSFDAIYRAVPPLIAKLRAGGGPVLIEAKVVRIDPHSNSDDHRKYRTAESILAAAQKDPILIAERSLLTNGILTANESSAIREQTRNEVNAAADKVDGEYLRSGNWLSSGCGDPGSSDRFLRAHNHDRCHQPCVA